MDIRSAYTSRLGSTLGAEPAQQAPVSPAGQVQPPPVQRSAPVQSMPSIPEEIGIDRRAWATYSPALRQALLVGKLPDLNPVGIASVIVQFDRCAPDRGFPPPPEFGNPGAPGGPPSMQANPGAPNGPPPSSDNPGAQNVPPPTTQTVGVQQPAPPMTQQAFVAPGGMVYVQAFAAPGGPSLGYYQLPQQMIQAAGYPAGIQPAGQAAPGGPQYPPMLGWFVLGGALLVTAWMLWEITKMKSQLHAKR